MDDVADPVGIPEIADRLGVTRAALEKWRQRHSDFPEPRWTVGGRPAWHFDDVRIWNDVRLGLATSIASRPVDRTELYLPDPIEKVALATKFTGVLTAETADGTQIKIKVNDAEVVPERPTAGDRHDD